MRSRYRFCWRIEDEKDVVKSFYVLWFRKVGSNFLSSILMDENNKIRKHQSLRLSKFMGLDLEYEDE